MRSSRSVILVFYLSFAVVLFFLFSGCSGGRRGYGVVLLSPDAQALPAGSVVEVLEESELNNTYEIRTSGESGSFRIDTWRIRLFNEEKAARAWADTYAEYVNIFGRNLMDGLAIREEADINAPRVYKMRLGQEIKIIEKTDVREEIGGHSGFWYRVLTTDGIEGYCFDYYLEIYDITAEPVEEEGPDLSGLADALSKVYRPIVYQDMIRENRINLDRFSDAYGLFPYPDEKSLEIRLYDKKFSFQYSSIRKTGSDSYLLMPAELELIVKSESVIQAVFTREDITYDPVFIYLENDTIQKVREQEQKRRAELYENILAGGPEYYSSAYGSISFKEDRRFTWEDLDRLVPGIIPDQKYREGRVLFDYFLGDELLGRYDGVIAFHFDDDPSRPILFLYLLEGNSLKLEYIPDRNVEEKLVSTRSGSPLIMAFFSS
jgi:hypothetical protein